MKTSYQICVSGAAKGDSVEQGKKLVEAAAEAIAKAGHSLMTGRLHESRRQN
jgi:phosphotransferase system IIA component